MVAVVVAVVGAVGLGVGIYLLAQQGNSEGGGGSSTAWAAAGDKTSPANFLKIEMVRIAPGSFMMGSELSAAEVARRYPSPLDAAAFDDEHPRHKVTITKGFWMGKYEVTRGQFAEFVRQANYKTTAEVKGNGWVVSMPKPVEKAGVSWREPGFSQTDSHPVVMVSHDDATAFCQWLSQKEGKTWRLPTEAEWEYACRAGRKGVFPWGDAVGDGPDYENVRDAACEQWVKREFGEQWEYKFRFRGNDSYACTAAIGQFKANPWGLHDMGGNAAEWCADWYGPYGDTNDKDLQRTDPKGPEKGASRVLRGGSWSYYPVCCRCALRYGGPPDRRDHFVGFRLALDE